MSKINLHNYEAFWLDYLENNLSPQDTAEFMLFVSQHPELSIDLEDELISLDQGTDFALSAEEKETIKERAELESLVILELDQELTSRRRLTELSEKYPNQYAELAKAYTKTKLSDGNVQFPDKPDLKRPMVIPMYWRAAAAAAVVGLIAMFVPWGTYNKSEVETAETTPVDVVPSLSLQSLDADRIAFQKSFDFDSSTNENDPTSPVENKVDWVAVENDMPPKDTTGSEMNLPTLENDNLEVAVDTTSPAQNDIAPDPQITMQKDSVITSPVMTENDDLANHADNTNLTVPEFLAEKVLKVERKQEEPLIASILDQKTNLDVDYEASESDKKKVTQFKVGKFEFYKSSKK